MGRMASALPSSIQPMCSGDLLPPSPPAEQATACEDQSWQSRADDWGGNGIDVAAVCHGYAVEDQGLLYVSGSALVAENEMFIKRA
jgi:hypothetical protein